MNWSQTHTSSKPERNSSDRVESNITVGQKGGASLQDDSGKLKHIISILKSLKSLINKKGSQIEIYQNLKKLSWRTNELSSHLKYKNEHAKTIVKERDWLYLDMFISYLIKEKESVIRKAYEFGQDIEDILDWMEAIVEKKTKPASLIKKIGIEFMSQYPQGLSVSKWLLKINECLNDENSMPLNNECALLDLLIKHIDKQISQVKIPNIKACMEPFLDKLYAQHALSYLKLIETDFNSNNFENRICLLRVIEVVGETSKQISEATKLKHRKLPWIKTKDLLETKDFLLHLKASLKNSQQLIKPNFFRDDGYRKLRDFLHHPGEKGTAKNQTYHDLRLKENGWIAKFHQEMVSLIPLFTTISLSTESLGAASITGIEHQSEIEKFNLRIDNDNLQLGNKNIKTFQKVDAEQIDTLVNELPNGFTRLRQEHKNLLRLLQNSPVLKEPRSTIDDAPLREYKAKLKNSCLNIYLKEAELTAFINEWCACTNLPLRISKLSFHPALQANFIQWILTWLLERKSTKTPPTEADFTSIINASELDKDAKKLWLDNYGLLARFRSEPTRLSKDDESLLKKLKNTLTNELLQNHLKKGYVITDEEFDKFKHLFTQFEAKLDREEKPESKEEFFAVFKQLGVTADSEAIWESIYKKLSKPWLDEVIICKLKSTIGELAVDAATINAHCTKVNIFLPKNPCTVADLKKEKTQVIQEEMGAFILEYLEVLFDLKEKKTAMSDGKMKKVILELKYNPKKVEGKKNALLALLNQNSRLEMNKNEFLRLVNLFVENENIALWGTAYEALSKGKLSRAEKHQAFLTIPYYREIFLKKMLSNNAEKELINDDDYIIILLKGGMTQYSKLKIYLDLYRGLNGLPPIEAQLEELIAELTEFGTIYQRYHGNISKELSKERAIVEFHIEKIYRGAENLLEQPEFKVKILDSVTRNDLLRLKQLRNIIAHNFFVIDSATLMHYAHGIIAYKRVDFLARLNAIKDENYRLDFSRMNTLSYMNLPINELLKIHQAGIFNHFTSYGARFSKTFIYGEIAGCNRGTQRDVNFIVEFEHGIPEINKTILESILSDLLDKQVKINTDDDLQRSIGILIEESDYREIKKQAIIFSRYMDTQEYIQRFNEDRYTLFFFENESVPRRARDAQEAGKAVVQGPIWEIGSQTDIETIDRLRSVMLNPEILNVLLKIVIGEFKKGILDELNLISAKLPLVENCDLLLELHNIHGLIVRRMYTKFEEKYDIRKGHRDTSSPAIASKEGQLAELAQKNVGEFFEFCLATASKISKCGQEADKYIDAIFDQPHNIFISNGIDKNIVISWFNVFHLISEKLPHLYTLDKYIDFIKRLRSLFVIGERLFKEYISGNDHQEIDIALINHYINHFVNDRHFADLVRNDYNEQKRKREEGEVQKLELWVSNHKGEPMCNFISRIKCSNGTSIRKISGDESKLITKVIKLIPGRHIIDEFDTTAIYQKIVSTYFKTGSVDLLIYIKEKIELLPMEYVLCPDCINNLGPIDFFTFILNITNQIAGYQMEIQNAERQINKEENYMRHAEASIKIYEDKIAVHKHEIGEKNKLIDAYLNHEKVIIVMNEIIILFLSEAAQLNKLVEVFGKAEIEISRDLSPQVMIFCISLIKYQLRMKIQENILAHAKFLADHGFLHMAHTPMIGPCINLKNTVIKSELINQALLIPQTVKTPEQLLSFIEKIGKTEVEPDSKSSTDENKKDTSTNSYVKMLSTMGVQVTSNLPDEKEQELIITPVPPSTSYKSNEPDEDQASLESDCTGRPHI